MRHFIKKILIPVFEKNSKFQEFYKNSSYLRTPIGLLLINIVFQRIFRINSEMSIQVNYTSCIGSIHNLSYHQDRSTKLSFAVSGGVYIQAANGIKIGKNFLFAPGVKIISANHDFIQREKSIHTPPVIIGSDVWLGANSIILPGVQLADGAIVGAGSIVTKSFLEKNSVITGNPAKLLRTY